MSDIKSVPHIKAIFLLNKLLIIINNDGTTSPEREFKHLARDKVPIFASFWLFTHHQWS